MTEAKDRCSAIVRSGPYFKRCGKDASTYLSGRPRCKECKAEQTRGKKGGNKQWR